MKGDEELDGWTHGVGEALAPTVPVASLPGAPWLEKASGGRHQRRPLAERGEDAVRVPAIAVTGQIGLVAAEASRELDEAWLLQPAASQLGVDTVEVSFGVTLTAGSGKAIEAVLAVPGVAAIDVTVSLARRPTDPPAG